MAPQGVWPGRGLSSYIMTVSVRQVAEVESAGGGKAGVAPGKVLPAGELYGGPIRAPRRVCLSLQCRELLKTFG